MPARNSRSLPVSKRAKIFVLAPVFKLVTNSVTIGRIATSSLPIDLDAIDSHADAFWAAAFVVDGAVGASLLASADGRETFWSMSRRGVMRFAGGGG